MILRNAHLFSQLLREHLPRPEFESLVRKHDAESHARGFRCWTQLVAMLFCRLGRADWLRVICSGLACCIGKRVHLGIDRAPNKSTLSYVNAQRPAAFLAMLLLRCFHHLSRTAWSFAGMAAMLRLNLFTSRDLLERLHKPFGDPLAPPDPYARLQLELSFPAFGQPN